MTLLFTSTWKVHCKVMLIPKNKDRLSFVIKQWFSKSKIHKVQKISQNISHTNGLTPSS